MRASVIKRDTPISQDSLKCVSKIQEQVLELIEKDGKKFGTRSEGKMGSTIVAKSSLAPHLQLF